MSESFDRLSQSNVCRKAVALLILVTLLAYCNSFTKAFVFDDASWITKNPRIMDPSAYLQHHKNRWLVAASILLNHGLGGTNPIGYHFLNFGLHLVSVLALFGFLRRTLLLERWQGRFEQSAAWLALAIAALWAVHPLHTQAVTYVIQRCESMMGMFFLLAMYTFVRASQAKKGKWLWYTATTLCVFLGMGAKEVIVMAPFVILAYDWVFLSEGSLKRILKERWPVYIGLALMLLLGTRRIWGAVQGGANQTIGFGINRATPLEYLMTESGVLVYYLSLIFWPLNLCFDYKDWPVTQNLQDALLPGSVIVLLLLATGVALVRRSWLGFAGAWFFLILAPTSSLMPIQDVAFEYRLYLPLAAVAAMTAAVIVYAETLVLKLLGRNDVGDRRIVSSVVLVAIIGALICRTYVRNEDYRSEIALWKDTIDKRPENARAYLNLASAYLETGAAKTEEVIDTLNKAKELSPKSWRIYLNLAATHIRNGDLSQAYENANEAVRYALGPRSYLAHGSRGYVLLLQGKPEQALDDLRKAIKDGPGNAKYYLRLGLALSELGRDKEAARAYQAGMKANPEFCHALQDTVWYFLGQDKEKSPLAAKEALLIAKQAADATGRQDLGALAALVEAYRANDEQDQALAVSKRALATARQTDAKDFLQYFQRKITSLQGERMSNPDKAKK